MITASVSEIRAMEMAAVAAGVAEYTLMCRAGIGAADLIGARYPSAQRFVILCGSGNNGGDALVVARELAARGRRVRIFSTVEKSSFKGAAECAAKELPENIPFIHTVELDKYDFAPGDVIVDGILGIGFKGGKLREAAASFIAAAVNSKLPVVALDLPSGAVADDGSISENGAVCAGLTITFGLPKRGLFCGECRRLRGDLRVVDIGLPVLKKDEKVEIFTNIDGVNLITSPDVDAHKNSRGRVLIWGGSEDYPGAPGLCAAAALHSGAGMVRLFAPAVGTLPNAVIFRKTCGSVEDCEILRKAFVNGDVLVAGCGWGGGVPEEFLHCVMDFPGKVVLDADGLNLLARRTDLWRKRNDLIITPHPGEAVRLARASGIEIPEKREDFAALLAEKFCAVTALKGRDTVVASPDGKVRIVAAGNSALATAGSGDVLAGVIGAFASTHNDTADAVALGVFVHGIAGECADGIPCADDLPVEAGRVIRRLRANDLY